MSSIFNPRYRLDNKSASVSKTLFTISRAIKNLEWEKGKIKNLTPSQIEILLFLNYLRPDAASVNAVNNYLSYKPSTVTGILNTLENKELIERRRLSSDRRQVHLKLTSLGIKVTNLIKDLGTEIESIINELNKNEREILEKLLNKVSEKIIERGYVSIAEICITCCYFNSDRSPDSKKPHYCECLNIPLSKKEIYQECPDYKKQLN
jgi:DNA-binding MarR family transcriptional regulator